MAKTETALEKRFVKICNQNNVTAIKGNTSHRGFVDRIVFIPHQNDIHFVEFKNKTYYQATKLQTLWGALIQECRGTYFLIDGDQEMEDYVDLYIRRKNK